MQESAENERSAALPAIATDVIEPDRLSADPGRFLQVVGVEPTNSPLRSAHPTLRMEVGRRFSMAPKPATPLQHPRFRLIWTGSRAELEAGVCALCAKAGKPPSYPLGFKPNNPSS